MQRKKAFLICAMAALMSFTTAHAESLEDAGKFEIKSASGDYRIGIGGLLTPTMEVGYTKLGSDPGRWGLDFNLQKARLRLYGNAFNPAITYLMQLQFENDWINEDARKGSAKLMDASVSWALNPTWFHVAVGKFAVPGSRQQVISAAKTQFLKASEVSKLFGATAPYNRDVGILFHNAYNHQIEYAVAIVSNGIGARLGYNHGDLDGYNAVDFAGGDLRFGVGVSGFARSDYMTKAEVGLGSVDYMVKFRHFASNGAFYYKREDGQNILGAGLDAGYLINQTWEPMLRYGWLKAKNHGHEIMAGLSHYWYGHNVKGQIYLGTAIGQNKVTGGLLGVGIQLAL